MTAVTRTIRIGSSNGLHARPAAVIAEAVADSGVDVTLEVADAEPVDGGSALMIMTLGATKGTEVTVTADDQATVGKLIDDFFLPYLDIPFQHAHPDVLKRMARPAAAARTLDEIARWSRMSDEEKRGVLRRIEAVTASMEP